MEARGKGRPKGFVPPNKGTTNGRKRVTLNIDPEIWANFKEYCDNKGFSMSEVVERLIREETENA